MNRQIPGLLLLLLAVGCSATRTRLDQEVSGITAQLGEDDLPTSSRSGLSEPPPPFPQTPSRDLEPVKEFSFQGARGPKDPSASFSGGMGPSPIQRVSFQQAEERRSKFLQIPKELPGAEAPEIKLPEDPVARRRAIRELYPPVESLPPEPPPALGPEGHPLTLADLQRLGKTYSPAIKNAIAAVEATAAGAYQAGMYPNPLFAFEHDTVETGPAGYPGFFIDQVVKTGGKLTVAQAAATMDILTAKLALRRACADLRTQLRGFYFAVLVARENLRVSEAMFKFTQEIYQVQVDYAEKGIEPVAPYDPMQLRPTVLQAQLSIITARNNYHAAWRQLTAAIGLPDMCATQLEGRVDGLVPCLDYKDILHRLDKHTDVLTAEVAIHKAEYILKSQKLVPLPDVDLRILVQKDYSTPPNQIAHSFQMSVPIPLWDQNRGGIRQAQWQLAQAAVGPQQAHNALAGTLAETYGRYLTARRQVEIVQAQLRDQVRYFRGLRVRWSPNPQAVGLVDLYVAQTTLVGLVTGYVNALGLQWQGVVDVANLLQAEDLFCAGPPEPMPAIPDMNCLQPAPSPIPDPPGPLAPVPRSAPTVGPPQAVWEAPPGLLPGAPSTPPASPVPALPTSGPALQEPRKEPANDK